MASYPSKSKRFIHSLILTILLFGGSQTAPAQESERSEPRFSKWATVELTFKGPDSKGRGDPNPFAIEFNVEFVGPDGRQYRAPGFYDGDGEGGLDGDVWKVRFSAGQEGVWKYRTESGAPKLDEREASFRVGPIAEDAKGFWKWGRLEHPGTAQNGVRYLKFRDGPYWLKAGCDDPENFLGGYENYNSLEKRIAAVDYLAERGINSMYLMTHNIDGDDKDVWPWLGEDAEEAKDNAKRAKGMRFDLKKMTEWRRLFEHMQEREVVPYLILEDDSAWKGYHHERYYREIIARFGDLPALIFNLGEENNENYSLAQGLKNAKALRELDCYKHPIGIHNVNEPRNEYLDADWIDMTSIQTGSPQNQGGLDKALMHNQIALDWIHACRERNRRVLLVNFDEGRPELDRRAWWSAYLGGGVWEAHVTEPYDRPMSAWAKTWTELGGARAFMRSLPFWEMEPANSLIEKGEAFCLAKPGNTYALYLPKGGSAAMTLPGEGAFYIGEWWNPSNGAEGRFEKAVVLRSGSRTFNAPGEGDWALRITRTAMGRAESEEGGAQKTGYFPPPESEGGWRKLEDPQTIRTVAGMDPTRLKSLEEWLRASDNRDFAAVVVRNGHVVLEVERGNSSKTDSRRVASVSKAVCATVLAIASEQSRMGKTPRRMTFDDPAFDYIPWAKPLSDPRKKEIKVRQLLNHTSGLTPEASGARNKGPWKHVLGHDGDPLTERLMFDPGTACGYSTFGLYHASLVCENVTGKPYDEYAIENLFKPIGVEHWWFQMFEGGGKGYGSHPSHAMGMPARDLARVAYCMLRNGRWKDRQIVPRWFVEQTAEPTHDVEENEIRFKINAQTFSHGWELPARLTGENDTPSGEGIPADARYKPGSGGQLIAFVPSLDLVVTRQTGSSGAWEYAEYLRRACAAVVDRESGEYGVKAGKTP